MDWLAGELGARGFGEIEFRSFRVTSNGGFQEFVLARKPAGPGL
jgi:hypothetical protein